MSSLGAIIAAVIEMRQDMRQAGATPEAIAEATERSVRSAWPASRSWKYLCQRCSDYGLEMRECPGDATCGRDKTHQPHEFGQPCWCSAGLKFKKRPKADDDFTGAGKVQKPARGFTRAGR